MSSEDLIAQKSFAVLLAEKDKISARLEAILAAIPDIVAEVDTRKVYTWLNQAGFDFFGEDALGKEAAYFFEAEQDTYEKVQPLFEGATDTFYVESWQRRRDGAKRLLAWWCRVLKDTNGAVIGAISTARDITDTKQAEETFRKQLDELQRWHDVTLRREERIAELKREVNELAVKAGEKPRYEAGE